MDTIAFIDLYCERTAPGFWDEPVNALSNFAFIVAALYAWRCLVNRESARPDLWEILLVVLAACIGMGSFLFHTFANTHAELADVIPIWSFVALYVGVVIYRSTGEDVNKTFRISGIALGITLTGFWFTSGDVVTDAHNHGHSHDQNADIFNGSLQYLPALVALIAFSVITFLRRHPARNLVLAATLTFALSLTMRTADIWACDMTGIGTHFLWHVLNAFMVGLLLIALISKYPPTGENDIVK